MRNDQPKKLMNFNIPVASQFEVDLWFYLPVTKMSINWNKVVKIFLEQWNKTCKNSKKNEAKVRRLAFKELVYDDH